MTNSPSPKKGEITRNRIIEAAYQLFMEQGYHGTSMRQIATRAEIAIAGIYNHFPNKEAIWEAVFIDKHPYKEIVPVLLASEGETITEFIRDAAQNLVSTLGKRTDFLNLTFIELVEFNGAHIADIFHMIQPELQDLHQIFIKKRGELRPIPIPLITRSFAGLFFSYFITEQLMPPEVRAMMGDAAFDTFVNIYLHGILEEPEVLSDGQTSDQPDT